MRLQLRKKARLILMIILGVVMVSTGVLAYLQKDKTITEESEATVLSYTLTPEIDSQFYLVENNIYDDIYLEDSEVIITQLVHHIYSNTHFNLKSDDAEYMELNVSQYEALETYFGEEDYLMWQKKTPVRKQTLMGDHEVNYSDEKEFSPEAFKNFLYTTYESLEIRPKALIKLVWDVQGTVVRGGEKLEIDETYSVPIPIMESMFMIDKSNLVPKKDQVTETVTQETPANPMIFKALAGVSVICLIGLLVLGFAVRNAPEISDYEKQRKRIFNDYGDRLAELEQNLYNSLVNMITVVKIEDLVKISDEIRQPIFYHEVDTPDERQMEFFVFDETRIYHLVYFDKNEVTLETFINEAV